MNRTWGSAREADILVLEGFGAGFRALQVVATRAGEPFQAGFGYAVAGRCEIDVEGGLRLHEVRMEKSPSEPG